MQNTLLWVGAGDIAQRALAYLDTNTWQCTTLRRSPHCIDSATALTADITVADSLPELEASHVIYTPTPQAFTADAYKAVYEVGLKNIIAQLDLNHLKRFIFVSSTAVYGADPVPQDEHSMLKPSAFNGQQLKATEHWLQQQLGQKLCIVRFSGLYGPGRYGLFERFKKGGLSINPSLDNYANRLHSEDAARVCVHLLHINQAQNAYLATDSTPLPLRTLYAHLAKQLHLPAPTFDAQLPYESKHFSNQRLLTSGFNFLYPQTLAGYDAVIAAYRNSLKP